MGLTCRSIASRPVSGYQPPETAAKRLKELERENTGPKRLVADVSLDNAILTAVTMGSS